MDTADIEAIKARSEAATRGPWGWRGHSDGAIELRTLHSGGLRIVSGMRARTCAVETSDGEMVLTADACGACQRNHAEYMAGGDLDGAPRCERPENLGTIWMWDENFVSPANKWAKNARTYRTDIATVEHPDAEFIAHAREDIPALIAEIGRLREQAITARAHLLEALQWTGNDVECAVRIDDAIEALGDSTLEHLPRFGEAR